ncbi:MAG: hypothetical protein RIC56_04785 [Pseudomonadales bacterium]
MDAVRRARDWEAYANAYWAAARQLADADRSLALPRLRLASLALEYRLRAFICEARGGTPEGGDLGRLMRLAVFCGLELDPEQRAVIERLGRLHQGDCDLDGAPTMATVAGLLEDIASNA